jgi:hypothetical protein
VGVFLLRSRIWIRFVSAALAALPGEGAQEPRFLCVPPAASYVAAEDALEFVESVGVLLDPWQRLCVRHALAEGADGRWAAFEFALLVARQNGKGEVIMALELAKLFLFRFGRPPLILHSAHLFPTAQEAFRRIREVIDGSDVLRKEVKRISAAHGEEGVELVDGGRLRFMARTISGAGRGFSPTDLYLDEVFHLPIESVSANMPALSAQPNPQIGYFCSAGFPSSDVLWRIVERGRAGGDPQLAYLEWSVPREVSLADRGAWLAANPAVGYRLSLAAISREYASMPAEEFARERLGIWADTGRQGQLDPAAWAACADAGSKSVGVPVFAVDVSPRSRSAAIVAVTERPDGLPHVEVVDYHPGVDWVVPRCSELDVSSSPAVWALDPSGPAGVLLPGLAERQIAPVQLTVRQYGQACEAFTSTAADAGLRHLGDPCLAAAIDVSGQRPIGDGLWGWSRTKSGDICPLVAATIGLWAWTVHGGPGLTPDDVYVG